MREGGKSKPQARRRMECSFQRVGVKQSSLIEDNLPGIVKITVPY
jgi:hypothetical protein